MDAALRAKAERLYQDARRTTNEYRPHEATLMLRRALRILDGDKESRQADLRARILLTLAYNEAEARGFAYGVRQVRAAEDLLDEITDPVARLELTGTIRAQHGVLLMRFGRYDESVRTLDEAVAIAEQLADKGMPAHVALCTRLSNRALAHIQLGHPEPARQDLSRCIAIVDENRRDGAPDADQLAMLAAKAHGTMGSLAWRVGDLPRALRYLQEASGIFQQFSPSFLPNVRMNQAEVLLAAGLADEAATYLDDVLPELGRQRDHRNLAEAEALRAAAALVAGNQRLARKLANMARRRFVRRGSDAYAAIATLTKIRAEVVDALESGQARGNLVSRALQLAGELAEMRLVDEASVARLLAVRLLLKRGKVDEAERELALVPAPRLATPVDHRMLRRLCQAELAVAREDRRRALRQAGLALAELGRMRDRMGGLELVCGTAVHGRELGELAIKLVVDRRGAGARQLFAWSERTRAQVYRYEPLPSPDDPVLAEKVREYRHLSRTIQEAERDGQPLRELRSRLATLQREVVHQGWRDEPWGRPRPIAGFAEVAERLGERVLVSFVVSGTTMVAVVVSGGRARLVRLGSVDKAAGAAEELHADLDALSPDYLPEPLVAVISGSARVRAERLDNQLLGPLHRVIGDRELVIVPTGALYAVAWGVLPSLRGRPVSVAPSATAWLAALGAPTSGRAGRTVLVGGPGLPAARGEVGRLRAYHREALLLDGDRARVPAVLEALDGAGLAHVAAHGSHEPENALFSQLELMDGALYAHETARLRRPPEHVVLAACELALSRIRPGDEALGFAGALLAAGGRTVTAAISRVGDQAAAAAMAEYHRLLAGGAPPAVALAEATAVDPLRRPFVCLGASRL